MEPVFILAEVTSRSGVCCGEVESLQPFRDVTNNVTNAHRINCFTEGLYSTYV